ncbi:MAG: glycogen-debranching protein, partial [Synechococcaceae bacterium WB9_2_112]|nr:glycogen-debranching protein [Synechococcaceae bacterium WB9_2_112]
HPCPHWHGVELNKPDWAAWSHCLAWSLYGIQGQPLLWCGMNAYHRAMHFDLPASPSGWLRLIDTALPAGDDLPEQPARWEPPGAPLESRSLMLLIAPGILDGN